MPLARHYLRDRPISSAKYQVVRPYVIIVLEEGHIINRASRLRLSHPYSKQHHSTSINYKRATMSCPDCFSGSINNNETPTGTIKTVHGREIYIAEPPNGTQAKGIIIIVPDAFGLPFVNNRILADHYARKGGFKVYLPDFMDGTAAPVWMIQTLHNVLNGPWLYKPYNVVWAITGFVPFLIRNSFGKSMPKVNEFFTAVRKDEGASLPVGAAGFCWGGPHIFDLAKGKEVNGKPLVDAVFTAHPSNLSIPGDVKGIKKPVSVAIGDKDFAMSIQQVREMEGALKKIDGLKSEVVVYPGAGHGFSIRADLANEKQAEQAAEAEDQAVKFFTESFTNVKY